MRAVLRHEDGMYFAGDDGDCDQCGYPGCPFGPKVRDFAKAYVFDSETRAEEERAKGIADGDWTIVPVFPIKGRPTPLTELERREAKAQAAYDQVAKSAAYRDATPTQLAELRQRTRWAAGLGGTLLTTNGDMTADPTSTA